MVNAAQSSIDRAEAEKRIWHGMEDTESLSRYYGRISDIHRRVLFHRLAEDETGGRPERKGAGIIYLTYHKGKSSVGTWTITVMMIRSEQ